MIVAVSTTLVGAGFKSGPYVKKIFATNNLKTLVAETQTIRNDIKQLDESMQMLVCESYNKVCRTVLPLGAVAATVLATVTTRPQQLIVTTCLRN